MNRLYRILWYFMIFLLPLEVIQTAVGGLDIRAHQVVFALTICVGAITYRKSLWDKLQSLPANIIRLSWYYQHIKALLLFGVIVSSSIGGIINGLDLRTTLIRLVVLFAYWMVFCLVYYGIRSRKDYQRALYVLAASTALQGTWGLAEMIVYQITGEGWGMVFPGRADGFLPEPNWFAMWLSITTAFTLPILFFRQQLSRKNSVLLWASVSAAIFLAIISLTRASWLAIVALTVYFGIHTLIFSSLRKRLLGFGSMLLVSLVIAGSLAQTGITDFALRDRLVSIVTRQTVIYEEVGEEVSEEGEDDSEQKTKEPKKTVVQDVNVQSRLSGYQQSVQIIAEHPIFGVGPRGFEVRIGEGFNPSNLILGVGVMSGILGLSFFVSFLYLLVKQSFYFYPENPEYAMTIQLVLLGLLITGMFNDPILMAFVWLTLGIIARLPDLIIDEDLDVTS